MPDGTSSVCKIPAAVAVTSSATGGGVTNPNRGTCVLATT